MDDLLDRVLGFLPSRGSFWTAVGFVIFLFALQKVNDWVQKKIKLPWMEEKNQQQRKALEQSQNSESE